MPDAPVEILVRGHRGFLAFLERRVGDRQLAEEILQAAMAKGLEHANEIRDEERVVAWFYRLLRNAIADHFRAKAAERRALDGLAREPVSDVDGELEQAICRCVDDLIPTLKKEYREVLVAAELENRPLAEIAANEGITANNATVRLHRARAALRKQLVATCGSCAEHACLDCHCKKTPL